jgi:Tol biopolymer transport system component
VGGGPAEFLTQNSGVALNFQPSYSPDGKTIAFISDRKGQNKAAGRAWSWWENHSRMRIGLQSQRTGALCIFTYL